VFINESGIKLEEIIEGEKFEEIPSFQLENDDIMQLILKKLHGQRLKWKPHGQNSPTWAFYVNDESLIFVNVPQVMHYMWC